MWESTRSRGSPLLLRVRLAGVLPLVKSLLLIFLLKVKENRYGRHPGNLYLTVHSFRGRSKHTESAENCGKTGRWQLFTVPPRQDVSPNAFPLRAQSTEPGLEEKPGNGFQEARVKRKHPETAPPSWGPGAVRGCSC